MGAEGYLSHVFDSGHHVEKCPSTPPAQLLRANPFRR
jgi:hypothetical protein